MQASTFKAIYLDRNPQSGFIAGLRELSEAEWIQATPNADVSLDVSYSSLNYKDGLALTDSVPVVRRWPMVPGIDAVGHVTHSTHPRWNVGDVAVLNGWGAGELHWGGLAQRLRASGDWLVPLPSVFTEQQAMAIGTAGYTAALCVLALERHGLTPQAEVLVTGATGGVGSIAVALLKARGYRAIASTGKATEADYLKSLGATAVIDRNTLSAPGKPLQAERWHAAIDTVGSHTLANVCAQIHHSGAVAACGLAQGMGLHTTVAPFILRGVSLLGIDSAMALLGKREAAWSLLAESLVTTALNAMTRVVPLAESFNVARALMAGQIRGRVVVDVNA